MILKFDLCPKKLVVLGRKVILCHKRTGYFFPIPSKKRGVKFFTVLAHPWIFKNITES